LNYALADVLPTYRYYIEKATDGTKITGADGYFDMYEPYRKGNSICLGKEYIYNDPINSGINTSNGKIARTTFPDKFY
jgi:endo-beta-N-acetylglucosaminidase D